MRGSGHSSVTISPFAFRTATQYAVRRAHHDTFDDCLAADKGLLTTGECRQHLQMRVETEKTAHGQALTSS